MFLPPNPGEARFLGQQGGSNRTSAFGDCEKCRKGSEDLEQEMGGIYRCGVAKYCDLDNSDKLTDELRMDVGRNAPSREEMGQA